MDKMQEFRSIFLVMFNEFAREKADHFAETKKHEPTGECAMYHMPEAFNGFVMWMIVQDNEELNEDGDTETQPTEAE